ncbi:MAG: hypothetical protein U0W40_09085 [Acidimicrobiia bacterium]
MAARPRPRRPRHRRARRLGHPQAHVADLNITACVAEGGALTDRFGLRAHHVVEFTV